MMTTDEGRTYGWDEPEIEQPKEGGGFVLLPAGNYPFTVTKFERGRHEGSEKLPACNKAIITVVVDGGDLGKTELKSNIFLHSKCEGIICAFFTALGHREHGQPLRMDWGRVVGGTGTCKVAQREGTDKYAGKQFNEIKGWLEPTEKSATEPTGEIPF